MIYHQAAQLFEMEQLKKIQSICNVARDDMSKLPDVSRP